MRETRTDIRRKRLTLNIVLNTVYEIVLILNGFVLPKLYMQYFGSEVNGLISSITKFLGFISICELGMGAVVTSNLYKPLAEKNWNIVSQLVKSAARFYRFIAGIFLTYTFVLTFVFPYIISTDSFSHFYVASLILIIAGSSFAQYFFGISYTMVLKADQKEYINSIVNCVALLLNTIFCSILIINGASIHLARGVTAVIYIIKPIVLMAYVKKKYNIDTNCKIIGEPIKQKWNGLAQHLAYMVQDNTDTIVLTVLASLQTVSIYSVYYNVVNGVKKLLNSVNVGMSSLLGDIYARGETKNLKRVFSGYEWTMHTMATLLFSISAVLITPFVEVYTNDITDIDYSQPLFGVLICVAILFWCYQRPYNMMVQAAIKYKETQRSAIIEPIINIIISVVLVKRFGLIGVAIGTIVSMAYRAIYLMNYLRKNILMLSIRNCIKRWVVNIIMFALVLLLTQSFKLEALTYLAWIVLAIKVGCVAVLVCCIINIVLYRNELSGAVERVVRRFRK